MHNCNYEDDVTMKYELCNYEDELWCNYEDDEHNCNYDNDDNNDCCWHLWSANCMPGIVLNTSHVFSFDSQRNPIKGHYFFHFIMWKVEAKSCKGQSLNLNLSLSA